MEPLPLRRGKNFEAKEKSEWLALDDARQSFFEKTIPVLPDRRGRADILIEERDGSLSIIEIKSTNWDRIKPHRIRPNVLRHIRQVFTYLVYFHEQGIDGCLGICYPRAPLSSKTRREIEEVCESKGVQIVWTDERTM